MVQAEEYSVPQGKPDGEGSDHSFLARRGLRSFSSVREGGKRGESSSTNLHKLTDATGGHKVTLQCEKTQLKHKTT